MDGARPRGKTEDQIPLTDSAALHSPEATNLNLSLQGVTNLNFQGNAVPFQQQSREELSPQQAAELGRKLGWDVIAHYPLEDDADSTKSEDERAAIARRNHIRRNFVWRIKQLGLIVAQQKTVDKGECMLKICATTEVLEPHAERIGMEMRTNDVDPITGNHLYKEFSCPQRHLFTGDGTARFFSSLERSRLIFRMIEDDIADGGAGKDIDKLVNEDQALKFVPLHDDEARENLAVKWLSWDKIQSFAAIKANFRALMRETFLRPQPLDSVRDYFGEKIALYFAWLEWYSKFLKYLAGLGVIVFIVQMSAGFDKSSLATMIYSIVLCVWSTTFSETWKRREATLAFFWDVQDFEEEEKARPEFLGDSKPGMYTTSGVWVDLQYKIDNGAPHDQIPQNPYFEPVERLKRVLGSLNVLAVFLFVLIVGTFAILAFRVFLQAEHRAGAVWGGVVAGIFNAMFIMAMNIVYAKIAVRMNDWENHRTDTEYEDRLIIKQFSFKFVNSYAALAFIAFAKDDPAPSWLTNIPEDDWPQEFTKGAKVMGMDIGRCKGESCMQELFTQLMTLQLTMIFVSNFVELVVPHIKMRLTVWLEKREAKKQKRSRVGETPSRTRSRTMSVINEHHLPSFEEQIYAPVFAGVLDEYTELMIQYGYVTLFAAAFPLSSFFALLNNILEVRIDGFKLLFATQRPRYLGAEDIGTWQTVLEFMSIMAVVSNCALICFTSSAFRGYSTDRESDDYTSCLNDCEGLRVKAYSAFGNYSTTNWFDTSNAVYEIDQFTTCVKDCACDSSLDSCYSQGTLVWIFVVCEHLLILGKLILAYMIPDKPAFVEQAEERAKLEAHLAHSDIPMTARQSVKMENEREWDANEDHTDVWDNEGVHPRA